MRPDHLAVAIAQVDIIWEDKAQNRRCCEKLIKQSALDGADIIVFPEMTLTGFTMHSATMGEAEKESETVSFFSSLAKIHKIAIIFGVIFRDRLGKGRNMAITVDKNGRVIARYQKIHPFSYAREDRYYKSGNQLVAFRLNGWKCAVAICYDLRFAGLFEAMAQQKPDMIFVIANWAKKRIEHWKILLAARALDTQAFVVGVNRVGEGDGVFYNGCSRVHGPDSALVHDAKNATGIQIVPVDLVMVRDWRKKFSSLRDKKTGLYPHL